MQRHCEILSSAILKGPSNRRKIALNCRETQNRQQYPKAIGDVNGKHAGIHKPNHGGYRYYN